MAIKDQRKEATKDFISIGEVISRLATFEDIEIKEVAGFLLSGIDGLPELFQINPHSLEISPREAGYLKWLLENASIRNSFVWFDNLTPTADGLHFPRGREYDESGWARHEISEFLQRRDIDITPIYDEPSAKNEVEPAIDSQEIEIVARIRNAITAFPYEFPNHREVVPKKDPHVYEWLAHNSFAETHRDKLVIADAIFEHYGLEGKRGRRKANS